VTSSPATSTSDQPAQELDDLTRRLWAESGVTPAPAASDREFLRRAYLDLVGRIPTPIEIGFHERRPATSRRSSTVDRLLASDEYASYWADVYVDLLLPEAVRRKPRYSQGLHQWLADAFSQGRPYDELVHDLVTAEGNVASVSPAAFAWAQIRSGGVDQLAQSALKLVLDEKLACAQCHDDPTDPNNTHARYERIAAYFARVHRRRVADAPPERRWFVVELPRAVDHERFQDVKRSFDGRDCDTPSSSPRMCLMSLVGEDPRFAETAVRRAWQHMFGHPLSDAPILAHLRAEFVASGYDLRALLRALALSEAYGRSSTLGAPSPDGVAPEDVFARSRIRPLDARRLGTSMLVAMSSVATAPLFHPNPVALQRVVSNDFHRVFDAYTLRPTPETNLQRELLLLNGRLTNNSTMLREGGRLLRILDQREDPADRVKAMFLAAIGREPNEAELEHALGLVEDHDNRASDYADVFAALLTSTEFITNH